MHQVKCQSLLHLPIDLEMGPLGILNEVKDTAGGDLHEEHDDTQGGFAYSIALRIVSLNEIAFNFHCRSFFLSYSEFLPSAHETK